MISKNENNKEDDFLEKLDMYIEDIKEIDKKGWQKREKAESMMPENGTYTFQLQNNKKYHDKDFNERQDECSGLYNPMKVWENNGRFLTQHKKDIEKSAEKGRQKREKVKNMIQERKKEENINSGEQKIKKDNFLEKHIEDIKEIAEKYRQKLKKAENMIQEKRKEENIKDYTLKPHLSKPFRRIRLKSSNNKDSYLQIYQNKVFNKKNKLQKKDKPIIKKYTSSTNNSNNHDKRTNDLINNKNSYINKYFDFNKNNGNAKKDINVFKRLYQDAKKRKVKLEKLVDKICENNANIDNKTRNKNLRNFNQNLYKRK